ncbi:MAG TPA: hypothetical protein VHB98_17535, partial [Chloroflexota bacterium]|nr:hypothetical protein [Chloroflexota bacterium]
RRRDTGGARSVRPRSIDGWCAPRDGRRHGTRKAYDAVIDIDTLLRDSTSHRYMAARYDSGDGLHPNAAGYRAMAGAIPLALFSR